MPPKISGHLLGEIVRMLRDHRKVDTIVKALRSQGLKEFEARELVLQVRSLLRWQIRSVHSARSVISPIRSGDC